MQKYNSMQLRSQNVEVDLVMLFSNNYGKHVLWIFFQHTLLHSVVTKKLQLVMMYTMEETNHSEPCYS